MMHRIGLIADVQYADVDDVWNFMKTHKRRYRASLKALRNAITWWNEFDVDFVADLGDAIDGCKNIDTDAGMNAIKAIQCQWRRLKTKVLHLVGNHELYLFSKSQLVSGIHDFTCICPPGLLGYPEANTYYSFKLSSGWRIVVLDSYDVATIAGGPGEIQEDALKLCQNNNPNNISEGGNFFKGLQGPESRWSPFNGALGSAQLSWLESVLKSASLTGEKLVVFSHVILHPEATHNGNCHTLLWNYDTVLNVFLKYPNCVKLVICGHSHHSGYFLDPVSRIHHVTIASPLEAGESAEETFGMLELHETRAILLGKGGVRSLEMDLN